MNGIDSRKDACIQPQDSRYDVTTSLPLAHNSSYIKAHAVFFSQTKTISVLMQMIL